MLPAAPVHGRGLRGLRVRVEQPVARRLCLERLGPAVQLAPGADGDGAGGAVRLRWVTFEFLDRAVSFLLLTSLPPRQTVLG